MLYLFIYDQFMAVCNNDLSMLFVGTLSNTTLWVMATIFMLVTIVSQVSNYTVSRYTDRHAHVPCAALQHWASTCLTHRPARAALCTRWQGGTPHSACMRQQRSSSHARRACVGGSWCHPSWCHDGTSHLAATALTADRTYTVRFATAGTSGWQASVSGSKQCGL